VGLTGSTATGKQVMARAAEWLKKLTLELGGSDPCIILDDADLDAAAAGVRVGRFFNAGQACLATKRVFVQAAVFDAFLEKISAQAGKMKPGNGLDPASRMGPMHTSTQRDEVEAQVKDALEKGARIVYGGGRPVGDAFDKGNFLNPVVLADVPLGSRMLTEEVLWPTWTRRSGLPTTRRTASAPRSGQAAWRPPSGPSTRSRRATPGSTPCRSRTTSCPSAAPRCPGSARNTELRRSTNTRR
jgi:hypothetical protein